MNRIAAVSVLGVVSLAGSVSGAVLWDQSAIDLGSPVSVPNAVATGFNGYTIFGVSDVSVPAGGWTISSVTTYFSALSWFEGDVTQAVLNVFPKGGTLPVAGDDPRASPTGAGTLVSVSTVVSSFMGNGVNEFTVSGLSISLTPGEYWVGLTPIGPGGFFGPDLQWAAASPYGASQASRMFPDSGWVNTTDLFNLFGQSGIGSVDGAILIQGVPAPSSLALVGLGGLCAARRRRR